MATCVECREQDSPGRIVPISYCEHRLCIATRRRDCTDVHTRACPVYCRAVGRTPAAPRLQPMTDEAFAWVREHVWSQAMRKTYTDLPDYYTTCPCQAGLTDHCRNGDCGRCHRGTPLPRPAGYITRRSERVACFPAPYEHPTPTACGPHRTTAAMFWYADRVCRWLCPHECHSSGQTPAQALKAAVPAGDDGALFALAEVGA